MKTRFIEYSIFFIVCTFLASVVSYFGYLNIIVDNLSNGRYQYFFISIVLLFSSIGLTRLDKKYFWTIILVIATLIINFIELYPYMIYRKPATDKTDTGVKVLLTNVLTSNKKYESVINLVNKEAPDIILVQEVDETWAKKLEPLKKTYKYVLEYPSEDNFGMSVYSKTPLENAKVNHYSNTIYYIPYLTFESTIDNKKVSFMGIHTLPPFTSGYFNIRNKMLEMISNWVVKQPTPVVIIGDLNLTPFSYYYKKLINKAGLINSRRGYGYYPSWTTKFPGIFRISLDHILHTREIETLDFYTGEEIGSDHLPVIARIKLKE